MQYGVQGARGATSRPAIGEALEHARLVSADAPMPCERRVIDVSGDGVSNEGRPPRPVAQTLADLGFTVNGLVIRGADPDPLPHFEMEVIAAPGAFIEVAASFEDYPRAILRKLLREIDQHCLSPKQNTRRPATPCSTLQRNRVWH